MGLAVGRVTVWLRRIILSADLVSKNLCHLCHLWLTFPLSFGANIYAVEYANHSHPGRD
jgi:hypothetical protein